MQEKEIMCQFMMNVTLFCDEIMVAFFERVKTDYISLRI